MSNLPRLYVTDNLAPGSTFEANANQSNYLLRVLRLEQDAPVLVFNGADGEWAATLIIKGKSAHLTCEKQTRTQVFGPDLELAFSPLKKARTDFVIEKATELGARTISPVLTQFTQSQNVRTDRFRSLAIEAAEQTERLDLPTIHEAKKLTDFLAKHPPKRPLFFCDESGKGEGLKQSLSAMKPGPSTILIGPEGGFSEQERKMLRNIPAIRPVTLGPRILRGETAAVAALAIWQSFLGDWHKAPYVAEEAHRAGDMA